MTAISTLDDEEFDAPAVEFFDDPEERDVEVGHNRQRAAQDFADLMGAETDPDNVAADLIETGRGDMVMWGVSPSQDSIALVPDVGDWSDPQAWLDQADALDLPGDLEDAVERLARGMSRRLETEGEAVVRRQFASRLGDLLRDAGLEVLGVKGEAGLDWIVLNSQDLAREEDGEPWAPPGGFTASGDLLDIGVSLGRGGRVRLWPTDAAPPPVQPQSTPATPRAPETVAAPPAPPPPPPAPPAARRPPGGSGLIS